MAGTDPYREATINPDLEWRKAVARLRTLLRVNPSHVHLFTPYPDICRDRWLSDGYVIVSVTGDVAVEGLPDATYKLTAAKGLVPNPFQAPNAPELVRTIESQERKWLRLYRTQWSVADSPFKVMLVYDETGRPLAINEGIWKAFTEAHWDKLVAFEATEERLPYRVVAGGEVVGYIARASLPEGEEDAAMALLGVAH